MPSEPAWKSLYPFQSNYLDLDGLRYHYLDERPAAGGSGETLLMVHGNPTWSFYWRNLVIPLRGQHRVVVPDHIGCGLSDKPRRYPYVLQRHIANLQQLVERLDLRRITLVAHDWGGAIGLGVAGRLPERFSRLVLMNTAGFRSRQIPWRIAACRIPGLGQLAIQGFNGFARAALTMATEKPERLTAAVRGGLLAPYNSWHDRQATYRFVQDIPLGPHHPSYATLCEVESGLARLADRPTLLIWGMRDWCFTPHFLERFLTFFPAAEVHRLADAGHYVVEDAHERIVPLLETFLARHPAR